MARKPRVEVPGGYFHITTRGVNGDAIFFDAGDRIVFLTRLARTVRRFDWVCTAYCLMTNHFHVVIQTPQPTLARGMEFLNGGYARATNQRYARDGHLFGRRYWSRLIECDPHLLEACRYVVRNPLRAGLCDMPEQWRWSSFRATAGLVERPSFLAIDRVLGLFGHDREASRTAYCRFVLDGAAR